MALFGNPNKKVEKTIKNLQKQGFSSEAYKTRKSCYSCRYFSTAGNCTYHNKRTIPSEYCHDYWAN